MEADSGDLPAPRKILVICTAMIGDVLLSTPVIRSLKARWPHAQIDVVVFDGTGGMLDGNTDITHVVSIHSSANLYRHLGTAWALWRQYDLACALRTSSVASFLCWAAGRKRVGVVSPGSGGRLKKWALHRAVVENEQTMHVLEGGAALLRAIGVAPVLTVQPPALHRISQQRIDIEQLVFRAAGKRLAVLHLQPRHAYKAWHIEGWRALLGCLEKSGFAVILTGGGGQAEPDYARQVAEGARHPVINLVGLLTLAGTAEVIRRASLYVGPDTSVTHLAAAIGTPTVALFGPTHPVRWGPWPQGWIDGNPWRANDSARAGNVFLLRAPRECSKCPGNGCRSLFREAGYCLHSLGADRVIEAIEELLVLGEHVKRSRLNTALNADEESHDTVLSSA